MTEKDNESYPSRSLVAYILSHYTRTVIYNALIPELSFPRAHAHKQVLQPH